MSILILCPHCNASRSDEPGCVVCALQRVAARSGVGGFTAEELELFQLRTHVQRLRAESDLLIRAISVTLIFRTSAGEA